MDLKAAANSGDQNGANGTSKTDQTEEPGGIYEDLNLTEKSDNDDSLDDNFNVCLEHGIILYKFIIKICLNR